MARGAFDMKLKAFKNVFFDRAAVSRRLSPAKRSVLSKAGAFVRRTAKKSIKPAPAIKLAEMTKEQRRRFRIAKNVAKRRGEKAPRKPRSSASSKPGNPPFSRTGLLKRFILFGFDAQRESVIIGPAKLNGVKSENAPETLEYGGVSTVEQRFPRLRKRRIKIEERPYMRPAEKRERPKLAQLWKDAI